MAVSGDRQERLRILHRSRASEQRRRIYDAARGLMILFFGVGLIAVIAAIPSNIGTARADDARLLDFGPYRAAAEYCRDDVARPLALSVDQRILCFDGYLPADQDLSLVERLQPGGLFVAHSSGGDDALMMKLADLLRELDVTVVIYGYCLFSCADYLVMASARTVVLKDALVAWTPFADKGDCLRFVPALDDGPLRLDISRCAGDEDILLRSIGRIDQLRKKFMWTRRVSATFEMPPQSASVRKVLYRIDWARAHRMGYVMWLWHPRYQPSAVKTKIVYEAYPESQEEVTALAVRLRLGAWFIYDP